MDSSVSVVCTCNLAAASAVTPGVHVERGALPGSSLGTLGVGCVVVAGSLKTTMIQKVTVFLKDRQYWAQADLPFL